MKNIYIIFLLASLACTSTSKWENQTAQETSNLTAYQKLVKNHQDSMSVMFTSGANGVIPKNELLNAHALSYFPPNENYRVKAVFNRVTNGKTFKMATTTDRLPEYKSFGTFSFVLNGDSLQLMVYQSLDMPEYLFLPFKDQTCGTESYGAGRYLDFEMKDTLNPIIDFNYCYNPLCAYNKEYSCPIPPAENHLNVRIEAGVKKWH
ncbi:MAG: hypothetical protein RLZZ337_794 [Bacteroidota bacterium]|jgi:uncharacterized protein (DUF1684 family)